MTNKIWYESGTAEQPILYVYKKGKSIIFENASINPYQRRVDFKFTKEQYACFYRQLLEMANNVWSDLKLQDVTGFGNDYGEYYDRELENDGSASIGVDVISFSPPAPHLESNRLYRFTKMKMQTYLYDLKKYSGAED